MMTNPGVKEKPKTPPPEPDTVDVDARIPLADDELRLPAQIVGDLDAIHEYSGRMPKECVSAMSFAFRSEEFTARYHVPMRNGQVESSRSATLNAVPSGSLI